MTNPHFHPATILATWFGIGFAKVAPGTWGSLAALPLAWLLQSAGGVAVLGTFCIVVSMVGIWAAGHHCTRLETHDPGEIVIDEVAGQAIACLMLAPGDWPLWIAAFILFRFFDIVKPWPISLLDRHGKGGLRVMQDDLAAGLVVFGLLQLFVHTVGTAWIP